MENVDWNTIISLLTGSAIALAAIYTGFYLARKGRED